MAGVFKFRSGRAIVNINPQTCGEELERLRVEKGLLTPEVVVDAATDATSPLHAAFEWDDTAAAHQYRISQARRLITSIRIVNSPASPSVVAYVSVKTSENPRSYIPTVEALSNEDIRARLMDELDQFIRTLKSRYSGFEEAMRVIDIMKKSIG